MAGNVLFCRGTWDKYEALPQKDDNTLYFLTDRKQFWLGDKLLGTGAEATAEVAGLLSAEDKKRLDAIVGVTGLKAGDNSVTVGTDGQDKTVKVNVSTEEGNILEVRDNGLFAGKDSAPKYELEKKTEGTEKFAAVYRLKCTDGETVTYPGAEIELMKDTFFKDINLRVVEEENRPYDGAHVGDPYLDVELNDEAGTHDYCPMKGLVDLPTAGNGIETDGNKVSVKLNPVLSNGLQAVESGLGLALATHDAAGAMSAADKKFLEAVPALYEGQKYEFVGLLDGARVDVNGKELRVMFDKNTQWQKPVGQAENRDNNKYYFGIRFFAPGDDVTGFKESGTQEITDEPLDGFDGDFAGTDQYGRKYSVVWYPAAEYSDETGSWTYKGAPSTPGHCVGWYHTIEWYNAEAKCVGSETVRINLTNEECHNSLKSWLGENNTPTGSIIWEDM